MAVTGLGRDHRVEVFAPSSFCIWNQIPWRNLQIRMSPRGFLYELVKFDGFPKYTLTNYSYSSGTCAKKKKNF